MRAIWFLIGLLLATLLLLSGCASTSRPPLEQQIMEGVEQGIKEIGAGWNPMDEDGYSWSLDAEDGTMIARCYYTYIKISGVEKWQGVFYYQVHDLPAFGHYTTVETDGLAECVEWVETFALGGYYL